MKKLALGLPVLIAGLLTFATPSTASAQEVVVAGGGVRFGGSVAVQAGYGWHHYHNSGSYYRQQPSITISVYETVTESVPVEVADYGWRWDADCGQWKWVKVGCHTEWQAVTRQVERQYTAYWYSTGYRSGYYAYTDCHGTFRRYS